MMSVLKTKNRKPKRLLPVVLSVLIVSMCFSQIIPQTAEAAKKKPAVKSVVLKVNGKKVTKKTIKVNRGSKVKVQVVVNPTKAKKSVKWSKLSKKQKKIATMKGNTITAKKNGTIKLTVKVKGKNGKTKSAWLKVKVVTPKTYSVRLNSNVGKFATFKYSTSGTKNLAGYIPNDHSDPSYEFVGWYTLPSGKGTRVTSITSSNAASIAKGTKITLYAHWVQKDPSKWVFQNSSGSGDLVNKGEAYEIDGIRSYSELGIDTTANVGWFTAQCTECGKDISFNVNVNGKIVTVTKIIKVGSREYAMSSAVEKANAVSADWMFIDITTAVDNLTYHDPCHTSLYSGFIAFSKAPHLSK